LRGPGRAASLACALIAALAARVSAQDGQNAPKSPWGANPPEKKLERTPADTQPGSDEENPAPYDVPARIRRFTHWISLEEEPAPSPPLLTIQLGTVWFMTTQTRLRLGTGMPIDDVEGNLHAREGGPAPWGELTIGDVVRAGVAGMDWERPGNGLRFVDRDVVTQDGRIASAGDLVETSIRYLQVDAFAEWDPLYGHDYRIGLTGGMRYTRLSTRLEAIQLHPIARASSSGDTEIASPILGGLIELTPVPVASFIARFQVIDWSWRAIELRNQRTFEARLGVTLNFVPDTLGLAFDFRFLSALASTTPAQGGRSRVDYDFDAAGIGVSLLGRF
jgi:hypothetical protein